MIQVVEYSDKHERAWDDYVEKSPCATIAHRIGFRKVIAKSLGHRPRYLLAMRGDIVAGILPLFIVKTWWNKRYAVSIPWLDYGGICADNDETAQSLLDTAIAITEEERAEFLELRSVNSDNLGLDLRLDKVSFILDLPDDPDVLWKSFDAKLRNQIRKSIKSELRTYIGGVEFLDSFYRVFARNMRDLGTPVWGKDLFRNVLEAFPGEAEIILVEKGDEIIAGGLILSGKGTQYVPSASSLRSYIKLCPNHALYWNILKRACETGYKYFDFGRSSRDSGTFRFKKQWGAPPEQLEWQYMLNRISEVPRISPNNPKYRTLIRLWKKLPLGLANRLGPRLIRNFP
jgi:FemAB-related protein (PEP-CTERM system-associated)